MALGSANAHVILVPLADIPLVTQGDDIALIALDATARSGLGVEQGDVFVFAQKVISKVEGRVVSLKSISPSDRAMELSRRVAKDPRLVELILRESIDVVRARENVLIVRHRLGIVLANAGIDASNVDGAEGEENVLLLPEDPDASADRIAKSLEERSGAQVGVIVSDSIGRAWRLGTIGTAIGVAGFPALLDMRGMPDLFGRVLRSTEVGIADEIASAASMMQGQASEGRPIVLVRGLNLGGQSGRASDLIRSAQLDLFR